MKALWILPVLMLIVACAPQQVVCPDGSVAPTAAQCPPPEPAAPEQPSQPTTAKPTPPSTPTETSPKPPAPANYDADVKALLDKYASKVKSSQFLYAYYNMESTGIVTRTGARYALLGDKARATVPTGGKYNRDTYADTVYIDFSARTAKGFCLDTRAVICGTGPQERDAVFADYVIKRPGEWMAIIPTGAYVQSSQYFEDRDATVIRFAREGQYYEYYLDRFSGFPLRVGVYSDPEFKQLVGGNEYQEFQLNSVLPADVTP